MGWLPPPVITVAEPDNVLPYADMPFTDKRGVTVERVGQEKNRFHIEVPKMSRVATEQESDTLCWAACTQMALMHRGIHADQEKLGALFRPDLEDKSANVGVVIRALNPDLEPRLRGKMTLPVSLAPITSDQMIEQLHANELVIVGLVEEGPDSVGHACIVYGADFGKIKRGPVDVQFDVSEGPGDHRSLVPHLALYQVNIFDPWPKTGVRTISGEDFKKDVKFILSRPIARTFMLNALNGNLNNGTNKGSVIIPVTPKPTKTPAPKNKHQH